MWKERCKIGGYIEFDAVTAYARHVIDVAPYIRKSGELDIIVHGHCTELIFFVVFGIIVAET